jgi:hypothetical protein
MNPLAGSLEQGVPECRDIRGLPAGALGVRGTGLATGGGQPDVVQAELVAQDR